MSGSIFLDANVLVYAVDPSDLRKQEIAIQCIAKAREGGAGVISYQVVQEWFNTVLRISSVRFTADEAEQVYWKLIEPLWRIDSSRSIVNGALALCRDNSLSWWDALIVSAAVQAKCSMLLSEDLQHGREIGRLRIENPFL